MKVEAGETMKAPQGRVRGKNGRKPALNNKNLPDGAHTKDRWHKHFLPTVFWWVVQQKDPWNLPDEDVVKALQQIWDVVYQNNPYVVQVRDAVYTVVCIIFFSICHNTYSSDRPCNVSVTRGTRQLVLRLSVSLIMSSKIAMTNSQPIMSTKCSPRNS